MTPYQKKDQKTWTITVATGDRDPKKAFIRLTSATRDWDTAIAMERMLETIGARGKRWNWVTEAIVARRVTLPTVYDHYVSGTLDTLQELLADRDLRPLVDSWLAELDAAVADGTMSAETVRKYRAQALVLVGEKGPVWRSALTAPAVKEKLAAVGGSGTNRRRHAAAWKSVLAHQVEYGALEVNPIKLLTLPKSNRSRERWLPWPTVRRILNATPAGEHRAITALRHSGFEMQAIEALHRRDVEDMKNRIIWAHGRKNTSRDRQVIILDDEMWAVIAAYLKDGAFTPDAKLFTVTKRAHADVMVEVYAQLAEKEDLVIPAWYTLHASRHSFAVEMIKRGHELKLISAIEGHADERLLQQLYGKYQPKAEDLIRSARRRKATA
ncbi:MAG: tyrosine-type recombinase/integrase [Gemmatimonadaceae bacterium]